MIADFLGENLSLIAIIAATLALAWVYSRKESGAVWRDVAEGLEEKVKQLLERVGDLERDLAIEKSKPNQEMLTNLVAQSIGRMGAITKYVQELASAVEDVVAAIDRQKTSQEQSAHTLKDELVDQREDSARAMAAATGTLQSFGVVIDNMRKEMVVHDKQALERHDAIMAELRRPPTLRTRSTDVSPLAD